MNEITGDSLPQIKRRAVAFFDPDPIAGQHSGVSREYSFAQALKIFAGGELVTYYNYTLVEAAQIINDIETWMETQGWPIGQFICFHKKGQKTKFDINKSWGWIELLFYIRGVEGNFQYKVREILKRQTDNKGVVTEKYREHAFENIQDKRVLTPFKLFHLTVSFEEFARLYCAYLNR